MSDTVLVIAPHADDETLGCGGTILRHKARGDNVHWLLVTDIPEQQTIVGANAARREEEIRGVEVSLKIDGLHRLGFEPTALDQRPLGDLIGAISQVARDINPGTIYLPFPGDVHSDHGVVFNAASACSKWFRYPSVRDVRIYETPSETNFAIDPTQSAFRPNLYVDISPYLEAKLETLSLYESEIGPHPFPRSLDSIRALATLRGSEAGLQAAEAFMILKKIDA